MASAITNRLLCFALLVATAITQPAHQIPWVESVVHSATSEFTPFITYDGPTGSGYSFPSPRPTGTQQPTPSPTTSACSYWMEEIEHQGVAAFNPNATYQVFRNVKDYGAKGNGVSDDTGLLYMCVWLYCC
jgi:glucan 1,3-beta-glucosidase